MRSTLLVLMFLAVPAAFAQSEGSARQVLDECIDALHPDVVGVEDMEETCPDLRVALEDLGLTDLVAENQLSIITPDGLRNLRSLVDRYRQEPERAAIAEDSLAPVLESLRKPPVPEHQLSWFERLKRWLREVFDRKEAEIDTESWLARWLDEHTIPEAVRWGLIYGSVALVVLLALIIVINEIRTAARGRRRKSASGSADAADMSSAMGGVAVLDSEIDGERPSALLRMLIATLVKTGRLNGAPSLTHRELTKRARFDDSHQRDSFQKVAQLAEREVFSGKEVASDDASEALRVSRSLDEQLRAAT